MSYQELDLVWLRVRGGKAAYLHNKQFLEFVIATQFTERKGGASMRIMKVRGYTFTPLVTALPISTFPRPPALDGFFLHGTEERS